MNNHLNGHNNHRQPMTIIPPSPANPYPPVPFQQHQQHQQKMFSSTAYNNGNEREQAERPSTSAFEPPSPYESRNGLRDHVTDWPTAYEYAPREPVPAPPRTAPEPYLPSYRASPNTGLERPLEQPTRFYDSGLPVRDYNTTNTNNNTGTANVGHSRQQRPPPPPSVIREPQPIRFVEDRTTRVGGGEQPSSFNTNHSSNNRQHPRPSSASPRPPSSARQHPSEVRTSIGSDRRPGSADIAALKKQEAMRIHQRYK
eukprot:CAMPEP_0184369374 /NCGR_PEP_ID=MMETSP1089-20130417/162208_1 /TAXON_ID=38269 ORGANISM="Gloeochaete wittrockiana, Strain SAG46.84" /NCGR_SAMPLE_ID=MMETSP1089 /ASSEMBLY_ACC=CAM_ASM_000445 /LENGTH=255 /DNA_ID=CAMNT_0026711811 /DNA_START=128 /DNA_END=895 /DNA_ORIENTATION=-